MLVAVLGQAFGEQEIRPVDRGFGPVDADRAVDQGGCLAGLIRGPGAQQAGPADALADVWF
jgi:hypothetical protein